MKSSSKINVRNLTVTAILAACASVLMFLKFNVPFMPSFISLDFSELPALIAAYTLGPVSGVVVCLVKNIASLMQSITGGVGELSNFLLGVAFVVPAGLIFKKFKNKTGAVTGALIGAVTMALFSVVTNYFIVYPIYFTLMPMESVLGAYHVINPFVGTEPTASNLLKALLAFNMPFTFIKGMLSVVLTFIVYKPLAPIITGKRL